MVLACGCAASRSEARVGVASGRRLRVGRRLMLYLDDTTDLIEQIRRHDEGDRRSIIVRPTNLEDVYLSLTGISLEANP